MSDDELGGVCHRCGENRGWKWGNASGGGHGLFCRGCEKGSTVFECPKCGADISGKDLLAAGGIGDVIVMILLLGFVLFVVIAISQ